MPTRSARHRPRHRAEGPRSGRRGPLTLAVVLVAALSAAAIALAGSDPEDRSGATGTGTGSGTPATSTGPGSPAATGPATRAATPAATALLEWAGRELPPGTRLRADEDVREDLLTAGAPVDLVATDEPTGPDDLVLTVTEGSAEPGGRVVARFDGLVLGDPSPGAPPAELLDRRRTLAGAILANPTTRAPEPAAAVLRSADLDMRLLSLLAVLTAREGLGIAAFPRTEGAEGPARSVLLDSVGGARVGTGEPATEELRTWLEAQLPPFAPDRIEVTDDGVLLSYRYAPDPDALVAEASP